MIHLTKVVATEYAAEGIRVNSISPGFIKTPMTEPTLNWELSNISDQIPFGKYGDLLRLQNPGLKATGNPEDIGEAAAFLLSDRSSFISGVDLAVDLASSVSTALMCLFRVKKQDIVHKD